MLLALVRHEAIKRRALLGHQPLELGALCRELLALHALLLQHLGANAARLRLTGVKRVRHADQGQVGADVGGRVRAVRVEHLDRCFAQPLGQVWPRRGERLVIVGAGIFRACQHCQREAHHGACVLRRSVRLLHAENRRHAEHDTHAVSLRLEKDPVGRDDAVDDVVLPGPLEQSIDLTQDCRDTRRRELLACGDLLGDRRVGGALRDDGECVAAEPAPLHHRDEAPVRRSGQELGVGREM